MSSTPDALRKLHRILLQIRDLHERIERLPRQLQLRTGNLQQLQGKLTQLHDDIRTARLAGEKKELLLKSNETKIEGLKAKIGNCKNDREIQALKQQIAADEMACSVLTDEIMEAIERAERLKSEVPPAEQVLAQFQADFAKAKADVDAQLERLRPELASVEAELQATEDVLPAEIRDIYRKMVKTRGSESLAPVENQVCTSCYQQITINMVNDLRLSRIVFCKNCGSLLYLPE